MSNITYAVNINLYEVSIKYNDGTPTETVELWATDEGLNEWVAKRTNHLVEDVLIVILKQGIKAGEPVNDKWFGSEVDMEEYVNGLE
jgi:hypothetical protein